MLPAVSEEAGYERWYGEASPADRNRVWSEDGMQEPEYGRWYQGEGGGNDFEEVASVSAQPLRA